MQNKKRVAPAKTAHLKTSRTKAKRRYIDFQAISTAALVRAPTLVEWLLPGGRQSGSEYIVRNPRRQDHRPGSFSINLRSGVWKDFAVGDGGGDLISLFAYIRGVSQREAALRLSAMLGIAS